MSILSLIFHSVLFVIFVNENYSFTINTSIIVRPVESHDDIQSLADIRYKEWMADLEDPPSEFSFRRATAGIHRERSAGGSRCFLAWDKEVSVGAVELSPIELEGVVKQRTSAAAPASKPKMLYVTDLVTDKDHRRKGVAATIMRTIEQEAIEMGATQLLLHVERENTAALEFYRNPKRGFIVPTSEDIEKVDLDRLTKNTGTEGQILMVKPLAKVSESSLSTGQEPVSRKSIKDLASEIIAASTSVKEGDDSKTSSIANEQPGEKVELYTGPPKPSLKKESLPIIDIDPVAEVESFPLPDILNGSKPPSLPKSKTAKQANELPSINGSATTPIVEKPGTPQESVSSKGQYSVPSIEVRVPKRPLERNIKVETPSSDGEKDSETDEVFNAIESLFPEIPDFVKFLSSPESDATLSSDNENPKDEYDDLDAPFIPVAFDVATLKVPLQKQQEQQQVSAAEKDIMHINGDIPFAFGSEFAVDLQNMMSSIDEEALMTLEGELSSFTFSSASSSHDPTTPTFEPWLTDLIVDEEEFDPLFFFGPGCVIDF